MLGVRAWIACVSENHAGHWVVRFSLVVEKKTLLEWLGSFVFGLPLTAKWHQFRMVQAPFTKYAGCKNIVKNAFVQLVLQENGYPIQYKPLTIQTIPYRYPSKKRPNRGQRKSNYRP